MGHHRQEPAREVLSPNDGRTAAACRRSIALVALRYRRPARARLGGGGLACSSAKGPGSDVPSDYPERAREPGPTSTLSLRSIFRNEWRRSWQAAWIATKPSARCAGVLVTRASIAGKRTRLMSACSGDK